MSRSRRYLSVLLAVVIAAVFVLSAFVVVFESKHNCTGDDCRICQTVSLCLKLFENTTPKPETAMFAASVCFAIILIISAASVCLKDKNLITLKVKLSN